jgi:hypothetical protein
LNVQFSRHFFNIGGMEFGKDLIGLVVGLFCRVLLERGRSGDGVVVGKGLGALWGNPG